MVGKRGVQVKPAKTRLTAREGSGQAVVGRAACVWKASGVEWAGRKTGTKAKSRREAEQREAAKAAGGGVYENNGRLAEGKAAGMGI